MLLLVPAYPGSPRQKAVNRLCVCVCYDKWRTSEGDAEGCKMAMRGLQ